MINCARCGRWIMVTYDELDPLTELDCEDAVKTVDGYICGCCLEDYVKTKKLKNEMEELGLIE